MSVGDFGASGHYSAPSHPHDQQPMRYYERPITSDWDLPLQPHGLQRIPMRPQQIQSQFAALDHGESGPYHHQAPVLGHPGLLSYGDAKGSSFREHEVGPHPNPRALQSYPANYARESLRRESDQFVLPQQPSMKLDSGGHPYQDHFLSFNAPYPRHITGNRAIAPVQPPVLHDYGRPQTAHASALGPPWPLVHASCHQQPSEHGNDDVVDVESSQRFRQPPHKFQNHLRPSTSPSPALQPAQMYSQNLASDGHQEEVPATCGVGIVFHSSSHGSLAVKRLVPGGPAARCGIIKQGDILTHIDETNVYQQTASDINHLISGPQGSYVRLKFKRSGSNPVVAVVERVWAPSTAERSKALSNGGGPPSKISQLLWLGDSSNSRDLGWLMENNVSFILNCAAECANHHTEKLNYLHLRLLDKPEENVRRAFDTAFAFLQKAHQAGHVVYVHCAAGRSRSATLVIAYVMKSRRLSLRNAIYAVRLARPMIKPNIGFFQQLCRYEKDLLGTKSCDVTDFTEFFKS